jgi:hypothetical protein
MLAFAPEPPERPGPGLVGRHAPEARYERFLTI